MPHFRSAEVLQARLEKGDLVRIGHVSPKANRNDLGVRCIPPAVAARCGPAPPHPFLRGALATCPPRGRLSPVRACVISSSLVSGHNEAPCPLRSLLLRPSRESRGSGADKGPRGPFRASDVGSEVSRPRLPGVCWWAEQRLDGRWSGGRRDLLLQECETWRRPRLSVQGGGNSRQVSKS